MDSIKKGKQKNKKRETNEGKKWRKTVYWVQIVFNEKYNIMPYSLDDNLLLYNMIALTWVEFTWTFLSFWSSAQLALQAEWSFLQVHIPYTLHDCLSLFTYRLWLCSTGSPKGEAWYYLFLESHWMHAQFTVDTDGMHFRKAAEEMHPTKIKTRDK